mgnify:CR=1 FL=1
MNHKLIITPHTKVSELLDAYPELEPILLELSPAFEKLKNPLLRKTIARFTTLKHAASIAGLKVEDIINRLREETGQQLTSEIDEVQDFQQQAIPEWYNESNIVERADAAEILNNGEEPVYIVLPALKDLPAGKIYLLTAPFLPAPLIEKAASLGCKTWIIKQENGTFHVYFSKG